MHREFGGAEQPAGLVVVTLLIELHEEGAVRVLLHVVEEGRGLLLVMELLQDHVRHGHPERAVAAGVQGHPLVRVLADLAEVGREDDGLGSVVARFGEEVTVGRAGHVEARPHVRDHLGVVPVRALADVGLVAPDLGERRWQVAVPVVEAEVDAAEELQETGAGGVAQHGHGGNRREADDPIRSVLLRGVDVGDRDEFQDLVPGGAPEAALAARLLVLSARVVVGLKRLPGLHRVAGLLLLRAVGVQQRAADERVLDAQGAVEVPGEGDPALAAARLVGRKGAFEERVIELLGLPGHDSVLDVDLPRAPPRAVHAVRAAHDAIVLEAVAVELLPLPGLGRDDVFDPTHVLAPLVSWRGIRTTGSVCRRSTGTPRPSSVDARRGSRDRGGRPSRRRRLPPA